MGDELKRMGAPMIGDLERLWGQKGGQSFAEMVEARANISQEERIKNLCEIENAKEGTLHLNDGYSCRKCLNRGHLWVPVQIGDGWQETYRRCDCWRVRASIRRMKKSGLENTLHKLSEFEITEDWQRDMVGKAQAYLAADHSNGASMFIGGAVGCGKTFVCAAVCRELLHAGHEVIYMQWVTDAQRLKALAKEEGAAREIAMYSHAEYLYIDDLFKPTGENTTPTPADIRLAYDIINYRYVNKKPMLISSEKYMPEILAMDEATASRLYERAKGFTTNVKRDPARNFRMRGADVII